MAKPQNTGILLVVIAILVPMAGAMGYVHGTFAKISRVDKMDKAINRVDGLVCKMAIKQRLDDAEEICVSK